MRRSVVTQFMSVRVGAMYLRSGDNKPWRDRIAPSQINSLKLNNGKSVLGSSMTKRRNLRRGDE